MFASSSFITSHKSLTARQQENDTAPSFANWSERAKAQCWEPRSDSWFWSESENAAQPAAKVLSRVASEQQEAYLKYGDGIILQMTEEKGDIVGSILHGNGFSSDLPRMQAHFSPTSETRQCLWEVVPQLLYDAAKMLSKGESELVRAKDRHDRNVSVSRLHRHTAAHSAQLEVRLQSLRIKAREEEEDNEDMIRSYGETLEMRVQFRDTIQLRHLPSGKFLSLVPRITAELDPECMKVELTGGSDASIFRVQPRCKISLNIYMSVSNE